MHDEDKAWVDVVDAWQWLPAARSCSGSASARLAPRLGDARASAGAARLLTPATSTSNPSTASTTRPAFCTSSPRPRTRRAAISTGRASTATGTPERVTPANHPGDARLRHLARRPVRHPHVLDNRPASGHRSRPPALAPGRASARGQLGARGRGGSAHEARDRVLPGGRRRRRAARRLDDQAEELRSRRRSTRCSCTSTASPRAPRSSTAGGATVASSTARSRTRATSSPAWTTAERRRRRAARGARSSTARSASLASKEQAAAVGSSSSERSYLDPERVASWGWSGGGSMTLNLLFRSPELYKVGMSVAPVPDQTLYDTIYQERYMGLPQRQRRGLPRRLADHVRRGTRGQAPARPRLGRRQRPLPGLGAARQPADRARQAVRRSWTIRTAPHAIREGDGTSVHLHELLARFLMQNLPPDRLPRAAARRSSPPSP